MNSSVVLITGALSGIGKAAALAFARGSYRVPSQAAVKTQVRRLPASYARSVPMRNSSASTLMEELPRHENR